MKLTSSLSEDLGLQQESQKLVQAYKRDVLGINLVNGPIADILVTLQKLLVVQKEQPQVQVLESEAD